ncbi:hypothetical protein [Paenibacillus abyssi]|uniref:Uncharacterized protein n=1 Tax=Paenibacillus abyssi TaxID=1340531 RepID=A0A917G169_9BACL|nr:hypothetical protein [Paenibacillus abyssi]GGG17832.1 hypothetical protein GCM10010916_38300 [Paenibacillus abyssi]
MQEPIDRSGGKRIDILDFKKIDAVLPDGDLSDVEIYLRSLTLDADRNLRIFERAGIKKIHLTKHAKDRWDSRVGPANIEEADLTERITTMSLDLGRIELLSKECGLIDNDIVFIYEKHNDQMNIVTFYGRISHRPALHDVKQLKIFNYKELDDANFELTRNELNEQILPPVPQKRLKYKGSFVLYTLDAYANQTDAIFHLTEVSPQGSGQSYFRLRDTDIRLSKSTVKALRYLGYGRTQK